MMTMVPRRRFLRAVRDQRKMPLCYSCGERFDDWRQLASHVIDEHPDSKGATWARSFLRKNSVGAGTRRAWARQEQARRERQAEEARRQAEEVRSRWKGSNDNFWKDFASKYAKVEEQNKSLQEQAMDAIQKLFESNMTDGEVSAVVNIAKKRAVKK
jgi:hypothetical protein